MAEVLEYLVDSGTRPGFSGTHGPGWYLVDYEVRTIRQKPLEQGETLTQEGEAPVGHSDAITEVSESEAQEHPEEEENSVDETSTESTTQA